VGSLIMNWLPSSSAQSANFEFVDGQIDSGMMTLPPRVESCLFGLPFCGGMVHTDPPMEKKAPINPQ